jgi:hypothetical protein
VRTISWLANSSVWLRLGNAANASTNASPVLATREAKPADAGATGAAANMAQQVGASVGTVVLNTIAATATAAYQAAHWAAWPGWIVRVCQAVASPSAQDLDGLRVSAGRVPQLLR